MASDPDTVLTQFYTHLQQGEYDHKFLEIAAGVALRKEAIGRHKIAELKAGDKVRFTQGRPRYLIGVVATVVKPMNTWVQVRLDKPIGKFGTGIIRSPISCIERVLDEPLKNQDVVNRIGGGQ
jgi:hypothetical protein